MYKATVTETSNEGGVTFVGASSPMYVGRFEFGRDRLSFYNNISPYQDKGQGVSPDLINSWEIQHSDYRLAESDGKVLNKEEENDKINWDQKRFFKIDWKTQAINLLGDGAPCFEKVSESLVEGSQEVAAEHFSFTLETSYLLKFACPSFASLKRRLNSNNLTFTMQVKHSFAPLPVSDYQPLVYKDQFDPKRKQYGFFETVVDRLNPENGRFEKVILANRWDPRKQHVIYLTGDFPADYEWIYTDPARGIGAVTNRLFKQHDIPMSFRFVKDETKKFGDVRYSFIKFVDKYDDNAPLGYGPSDAHPLTGEILRSDTVIWTAALKDYVRRIRDYELQEPKLPEELVLSKMTDVLNRSGLSGGQEAWLSTARKFDSRDLNYRASDAEKSFDRNRSRYELQKVIAGNLFANPGYANYTAKEPFAATVGIFAAIPADTLVSTTSLGLARNLMARAGQQIPADVTKKLQIAEQITSQLNVGDARLAGLGSQRGRKLDCVYPLEEQLAVAGSMVLGGKTEQQIVDTILYRVAVHEFGHNLNLRHNFYGSVDYQNFANTKPQVDRDGKVIMTKDADNNETPLLTEVRASSVMDYLALTDEYNVEHDWESYDAAALVFAYSDAKIDLAKVDLDPVSGKYTNRSLPRVFLYCTDEHRLWNNPFCNAFDVGTTPSEIAMSYIKSYARAYQVRNNPYGRAYWDTSSYAASVAGDMINPLKFLVFHDEIGSWLGQMSEFSSFADVKEYGRITQEIREDARRAATLLAGFYAGVIKFSGSERNILDDVDRFTGDVERLGVFSDKLYATYALGGNFEIQVDTLGNANQTNFVKYLNQGDELGAVVREQMLDIAVENIEWARIGLESFGRSLLASTAIEPSNSNLGFLNRLRMSCFTRAGLKQAFGIDADRFYPYNEGSETLDPLPEDQVSDYAQSLTAGLIKLGGGLTKPLVGISRYPVLISSEFNPNETIDAAVVRVENNYYIASRIDERSGYAYEFIRRRIDANSRVSVQSEQLIKQSKVLYDLARFGEVQDCIDYQSGVDPIQRDQ